MKSPNGVQIRKDLIESYKCKSEQWMETEYDDNVLDYWKIEKENYQEKFKKDGVLEGDYDVKKTLSRHLGAFILSNSK